MQRSLLAWLIMSALVVSACGASLHLEGYESRGAEEAREYSTARLAETAIPGQSEFLFSGWPDTALLLHELWLWGGELVMCHDLRVGEVYLGGSDAGVACYRSLAQRSAFGATVEELGGQARQLLERERAWLGRELGLGAGTGRHLGGLRRGEPGSASSPGDLLAAHREAIQRFDRSLLGYFRRLPGAKPRVELAVEGVRSRYEGGSLGRYLVRDRHAEDRWLAEVEPLVAHEGVPGHHLQLSYVREYGNLGWRSGLAYSDYDEGWATYAEWLAEEMELYAREGSRLGLSYYRIWRATRALMDVGLHLEGWTESEALAFCEAETGSSPGSCHEDLAQIRRMPSYALGYLYGAAGILAARERARVELGECFVVADFHDWVLRQGPMPTVMLRARVGGWIGTQREALSQCESVSTGSRWPAAE